MVLSLVAMVDPTMVVQPSFGLSVSPDAASQGAAGTSCSSDYITIPQGMTKAIAAILMSNTVMVAAATYLSPATRYCGRYLQTSAATFNTQSICSLSVPFELGVDFNDDEVCTANTGSATCEFMSGKTASTTGGGGILGFSLCYTQTSVS